MDANRTCPSCKKPLPPDAPMDLCPECLAKAGFKTAGDPMATVTTSFTPPSIPDLTPLFPHLEIIEFLGMGGMGAVYKARQPALDRFVALKILAPSIAGQSGFAERFNREARALARLNHPNIVAVHDFGKAGELHYLIMEFVEGANLRQIERAGILSPAQALAIVPQICAGLQYAHQEGIVHRDIKPENILVDKKGRLKITDFGIAKIVGGAPGAFALTGARDIVGTPLYMAPEQIEKPQNVDHRADIYSLGVVFYEMLTGELPLGRFQPPSHRVQVDVRLDEVVLRSLEKEPSRRYQQASEVKSHVETIAGAPAETPSIPPAATRPWSRRQRVIIGAAVFVLFIAAINLAVVLVPNHPNPPATAIATHMLKSAIDRVTVDEKTAVIEGRATTGELLELSIPVFGIFRSGYGDQVQWKENTRFTNIAEIRGASLHYRVLNQAGQDVLDATPNWTGAPATVGPNDISLPGSRVVFEEGPFRFADAETTQLGTNGTVRIGTYISNSIETPVFVTLQADVERHSDDTNFPLFMDSAAIGQWQPVDFVDKPSDFDPTHLTGRWLGLHSETWTFKPTGELSLGPPGQAGILGWSKGMILTCIFSYANQSLCYLACHYQIQQIQGQFYMFLEWKNDDYCVLGTKPKYYVLKKTGSLSAEDRMAATRYEFVSAKIDENIARIEGRAAAGQLFQILTPTHGAFTEVRSNAFHWLRNTHFTNILESRGAYVLVQLFPPVGTGGLDATNEPDTNALGAGQFVFQPGPFRFCDAETTPWGSNGTIRIGTYHSDSVETPVFVRLKVNVAGRYDDTNIPYASDEAARGEWMTVDFVDNPSDFNPAAPSGRWLALRRLRFFGAGRLDVDGADLNWKWTKGCVLTGSLACHYEIQNLQGVNYMFLEWKNDDYTVLGVKPKYYVLKKS